MPAQSSKEVLQMMETLETNLRIQRQEASRMENDKATAIELFRRASSLEDAIAQLKLPYTYDIIVKDPTKVRARMTLGEMSAEMLEVMRDELISAGVSAWMEYVVARNTEQALAAKREA